MQTHPPLKKILLSENHLATIQSSLKEHQNALLPLQQKRDKLTKALELSKANLDADEKDLQDSTAKIMAAKQELLKTTNDFNNKTNIKKAKSETHQKNFSENCCQPRFLRQEQSRIQKME